MKVTFYGETRRNFAKPSNESAVPSLGSFGIKEILMNEKWQEATTGTVSFTAENSWLQNNLFPGRNPSRTDGLFRRARYFSFKKSDNRIQTMVITGFDAEDNGDETSFITVSGSDPRIWFETMSSSKEISGENWGASRLQIAQWLSQRVSNNSSNGMQIWQRLPIDPMNASYSPTTQEYNNGIRTPSQAIPNGTIEIGIPDPLPIKPSVDDLLSTMSFIEIYPIDKFGADGTNSPWWEWGVRIKTPTGYLFSEKDGNLKINKYTGDYTRTETLAYNSNSPQQFSFASGENASRASLTGPWAGIVTESVTPPEGANINNFLRSKANTGTMNNKRMVIDCSINFEKLNINPFCGMQVNVRIGENIYIAEVNELTSHYSSETGWNVSSPVFVNMDSIDLTDPIETEKAITFVISGFTTYNIPTRSITGDYYNWRVFVDGKSYGVFSGSASSSGFIGLALADNGEHTITIIPADGQYTYGWGRAWAHGSSSSGLSSSALKRVLNDPDWAHIETETSIGNSFRAYQFRNCNGLITPVPESMPNSILTIGNNAFFHQYDGCSLLEYASSEYVSENAEGIIGDNFRSYQYSGCREILSAAPEIMSNKIIGYGDNFRSYQYYYDSPSYMKLNSAALEVESSSLKNIGHSYRRYQYSGTKIIKNSVEVNMNLDNAGSYFRAYQFYNCRSLENATDESSPNASIVGSYFRYYQFYDCRSLKEMQLEDASGISTYGDYFRGYQYGNCYSITEVKNEIMPSMSNVPGNYRYSMFGNCTSLTTLVPEHLPSSVLTIEGSLFKGYMFNGCTSLTYSQIEADWNNVTSISDFKVGMFSNCTSLTDIAEESSMNELLEITGQFQGSQYSNVGAGIAADERAMPKLKTMSRTVNPYRQGQYSSSKITEIGREADLPSLEIVNGGMRISMYSNCPNITNTKRYREGLMPLLVTTSIQNSDGRARQFENSGIVYPLIEGDKAGMMVGSRGSNGYRAYMYKNCANLIEVPIEQEVNEMWNGPSYVNYKNFRREQFANCPNIDPRGQNLIYNSNMNPVTSEGFRQDQYLNTIAKNTTGNRINYIDGTEVIEGQQNIPETFYSDPVV